MITKEELKGTLNRQSSKDIMYLFAYLYSRGEMIDKILSNTPKAIEEAIWEVLGWEFKIEKDNA